MEEQRRTSREELARKKEEFVREAVLAILPNVVASMEDVRGQTAMNDIAYAARDIALKTWEVTFPL